MNLEDWLGFFREIGARLKNQVSALSGRPEARREIEVGAGGDTTVFIDQWAEGIIVKGLLCLQTGGENFTLVSEELGRKQFGRGGYRLLVDPIDGSLNAKKGIPFFSTSIALIEGEELYGTKLGYVINLANGDEFWAFRGGGAFFNGAPTRTMDSMGIEIMAYEANNPERDVAALLPLLPHATRTRCLGSTALDLCYTACGYIDLFVIPSSSRCFDFAAGRVILEEAGGVVTDSQGRDLSGLTLDLEHRTGLIAASSNVIHQKAREILKVL